MLGSRTAIARALASHLATRTLPSRGIYVGLPLALIVARYTITPWRVASTKILVRGRDGHVQSAGHVQPGAHDRLAAARRKPSARTTQRPHATGRGGHLSPHPRVQS